MNCFYIENGKTGKRENGNKAALSPDLLAARSSSRFRVFPLSAVFLAAFVLLLLAAPLAQARVNVVSLPGRDTVQLTIYNSADLTLVKETRVLTLRKGLNRLEFSWANTLIDPTSLEIRALTHADQVDLLDASYPPRVSNTLEWRIRSEFAGEVVVEIRYFTSGITWDAGYVAEAVKDEKGMTFSGSVRVTNRSGEDYENAQIRLVVGVIRLVEDIITLANQGRPIGAPVTFAALPAAAKRDAREEGRTRMLAMDALSEMQQKQIIKEGVSEYFLYTVDGRDTIANGWSKRLPSFRAPGVPVTSYYKFERERWGDQVMRYYRFTNSAPSKLGKEPLPDGLVKAFRTVTDDQLYSYVGGTSVKYIPINEAVEMELGHDPEVLVKPTLANWVKTDIAFDNFGNVKGWTTKETWEFEVQNSKDIDVVVDIRRNFQGDWSLSTKADYEKVDATKTKFLVRLKPRERQQFSYELTVKHGTNATR